MPGWTQGPRELCASLSRNSALGYSLLAASSAVGGMGGALGAEKAARRFGVSS